MLSIFFTLYTSAERNSMSLDPDVTGGDCTVRLSLAIGVIGVCPFTEEKLRPDNNMMRAHLFMIHRIS
jgi:hypothetical protein